jgi:hypothetical protein
MARYVHLRNPDSPEMCGVIEKAYIKSSGPKGPGGKVAPRIIPFSACNLIDEMVF